MPQRIRMLIAVRDVHVADALCMELDDEESCAIDVAGDGYAALQMAEHAVPHVLVIDAVLPGMDGLRTADCMHAMLGRNMPRIIGGAEMPFADAAWRERGAACVLCIPWDQDRLMKAVLEQIDLVRTDIDWMQVQAISDCAGEMLRKMGMHGRLKGCTYLSYAAALAYAYEYRLRAVGKSLYQPIAEHCGTSCASVERLIRHAVESTMDAIGAAGVYRFFGNTIDPMRGKPTNAQMIALLAQRLRVNAAAQIEK